MSWDDLGNELLGDIKNLSVDSFNRSLKELDGTDHSNIR